MPRAGQMSAICRIASSPHLFISYINATCASPSGRRCQSTGAVQLQKYYDSSHSTLANLHAIRPLESDSFLQRNAADYIDGMYEAWRNDADSCHPSWKAYFQHLHSGMVGDIRDFPSPSEIIVEGPRNQKRTIGVSLAHSRDISDHHKVQQLVRAYQARGHTKAHLDPLGPRNDGLAARHEMVVELQPEYYGFSPADMEREFYLGAGLLPGFTTSEKTTMKLKDIISNCEKTYCGNYAVEYLHILDRRKCDWIRSRLEVPTPYKFSKEEKKQILDRAAWTHSFEKFLHGKYPNEKRFSGEGVESWISGTKAMIDRSAEVHGVEDVVIASCHRGRLNFMSNVMRKSNAALFNEFSSTPKVDFAASQSGDVKYHLGMNGERLTPSGKKVRLSMVSNPSHLEAQDPVAAGKARATQYYSGDKERKKVMCFMSHTDAALSGQGVVYETIGLSKLPGYTTGGTVHVIVNNQIGFTTDAASSRSSLHSSDIAKVIDAPVFHVNADDIEAVTFLCQLAADWRAEFGSDVWVNVIGYRKYGHNEMDQPMYTQPLIYQKITQKLPVFELYCNRLLAEEVVTVDEIVNHKKWIWDQLSESFEASKTFQPEPLGKEWLTSDWNDFKSPSQLATEILPHHPTAISHSTIKKIGDKISSVPADFLLHKNLQRVLASRKSTLEGGKDIDWATGEALAFGSLCLEGYHVRVSGEDVERGTFSQRHAVLHDQSNNKTWTALDNLSGDQARFSIVNSSLSEYGVMGFDYGYSLASANSLVVWEAQFGDFANVAQCIIDQFIASGEAKWGQRSGIVLSLPHGYDGQGPEHSSGRLERFLQLGNEDPRYYPHDRLGRLHQDCNIQVVSMTTSANLFHVLRRQMHRHFRKPLIIFFSKSLLRHPLAHSSIEDFTGDSQFQYVIDDPIYTNEESRCHDVERIILCTGQVYAALQKHRKALEAKGNKTNTAIIRIEQLHPFPWSQVKEILDSYHAAKKIVWCQEEPLNGGAWQHVQPRIETVLNETTHHKDRRVRYAGRAPAAAVSTGLKRIHYEEEEQFLSESFEIM